jgi:hypothetical protein
MNRLRALPSSSHLEQLVDGAHARWDFIVDLVTMKPSARNHEASSFGERQRCES